jgi:FtsP/CotA-like multicopper oxidase with cupredoxin domain
MRDMGMSTMDMEGMDMPSATGNMSESNQAMDHSAVLMPEVPVNADSIDHTTMDHAAMKQAEGSSALMDHSVMNHAMEIPAATMDGHAHSTGPGVTNIVANPQNRLHERPLGLEQEPHRVLVYTDLKSLAPNPDQRAPGRELELHLTSNMERYMWSFDGVKFSEVSGPIRFSHGERVRLTLVNDTMMPHPIHLHGMYFDVVTEESSYKPRKHTIVIKPAEKLSVDITADAMGDWAFHCHLLYHMHAGMMRVVSVGMPE